MQQALRSVGGLSKSEVLNRHEIERIRLDDGAGFCRIYRSNNMQMTNIII